MSHFQNGRKKYVQWLTPDGLVLIEGWARDGLSVEQIAHNMGIAVKTLYEWRKKYPPISEALRKGREVSDRHVENALYKKALGYEYEETKTYIVEGPDKQKTKRVEVVKKYAQPDTASIIYWLNNRMPNRWRQQPRYDNESEALQKVTELLEGFDREAKQRAKEK